MLQAMHGSIIYALCGKAPKQNPTRLTESTPDACSEFIRLWGEFQRSITAVDESIAMSTCMFEKKIAIIFHPSEFPTTRIPSISDAELLGCLRTVVRPHSSVSAVAMLHRLQIAAANVKPPHIAFEVYNHALSTWVETPNAITDANCWHVFNGNRKQMGQLEACCGQVLQHGVC